MKKSIKKILNFIIDLIFPVTCLGCQKEGGWLCLECAKKLKYKNSYQDLKKDSQSALSGLFVICDYQDEIIQKGLHLFKYQYARDLKQFFRQVLTNSSLRDKVAGKKETIVLPVPLHPKRKRFRGFNQSELIAGEVSALLNLALKKDFLLRKKHTRSQVGLDARQRNSNIKGAFALKNNLEISAKSAILIDDVYTTGSTMNEAAKVLKKAGIKEIMGMVIARG